MTWREWNVLSPSFDEIVGTQRNHQLKIPIGNENPSRTSNTIKDNNLPFNWFFPFLLTISSIDTSRKALRKFWCYPVLSSTVFIPPSLPRLPFPTPKLRDETTKGRHLETPTEDWYIRTRVQRVDIESYNWHGRYISTPLPTHSVTSILESCYNPCFVQEFLLSIAVVKGV